nr:hypothetical protein [Bacteroidota bacterium]
FMLPVDDQSRQVKQLYYYQEWLWCVLDTGLAALHVRLNDWLYFDKDLGLPSSVVTALDFEGDYVWASTANGLARFDLLIEQWEVFDKQRGLPDPDVGDLKVSGEYVWIIHGNGFSEYNPLFEKWRNFKIQNDTSEIPDRLFVLKNEIWLVCENGLVSFNTRLQSQQLFNFPYLTKKNLLEIYIEDERIWAITRLGIFYYDKQSGIWNEFEGNNNLSDVFINFGFVNLQNIWVLTDRNVMVWDRNLKSWEILDYSTGLSSLDFASVYSDGNYTFLFQDEYIDYQRNMRDPWRKFYFSKGGRIGAANIFTNLFDNEDGGYIGLGKYKWSWDGTRVRIVEQLVRRWDDSQNILKKDFVSAYRLDVKSQVDFGNMRRLSGFYNNVDYSDTIFGLRYRDNDNDVVRELAWGDFRWEQGNIPFGEGAEMFGANAWLQYGSKTPIFKRSLLSLKASTGQIKSEKTFEYYNGAFNRFTTSVKDVDYLKNQFFSIPGLDTLNTPENIRLYVDDKSASTNDPNTNVNATIAGLNGDFDQWVIVEDFAWYTKAHVLRMVKQIRPEWSAVVRYSMDGREYEQILQDDYFSTKLLNFYYLKGKQIIPYSFNFTITDDAGGEVPLRQFGIDDDGDGRVDSRWIDYLEGFLFFPQDKPFPAGVYDSVSPQSYYRFVSSFQTELSMIQLQHPNLVRGSESLWLDGILASGGNDYVLDYTNGTLIFVREGIISPDTRIEVQYEYYVYDGDNLHQASFNFSPSDNIYIQADWRNLTEDSTHLIDIHGEVRKSVGKMDFRLIPGVAYQTRENQLTGQHFEGLASSSWLRVKALYQHFEPEYKNLYREQSFFGNVENKVQFYTSADVTDFLRLVGDWKLLTGNDSISPGAKERSGNASFLLHQPDIPNIQFTYQDRFSAKEDSTSEKRFFQNLLEYQFPTGWVNFFGIKSFKIENFLRAGTKKDYWDDGSQKQKFFQGYGRLSAQITERIQTGFFYRANSTNDITGSAESPVSKDERLLVDLAVNEWRAMQVSFRVENSLKQTFTFKDDLDVYYLRNFGQVNVRFSPGQLWKPLSLLFFEFNYNQTQDQKGESADRIGEKLWPFSSTRASDPGQSFFMKNYFIKNEIRPGGNWFLYSMLEWNTQENGLSGSTLQKSFWRLIEKLDLKIGVTTHLVAQYRQFFQDLGYSINSMDYEPSVWIEHRWSSEFINIFNVLYRRNNRDYGNMDDKTNHWESSFDVIWRTSRFKWLRQMEIQQTFAGSHQSTMGYNEQKSFQFSSGTSLNLYPLHALVLRLRADVTRYKDLILSQRNYLSVSFNLKVSLRF